MLLTFENTIENYSIFHINKLLNKIRINPIIWMKLIKSRSDSFLIFISIFQSLVSTKSNKEIRAKEKRKVNTKATEMNNNLYTFFNK